MSRLAPLLVFAAASLASMVAHAGNNSWTLTGADSGPVTTLAVNPANASLVMGSSTRGLVRSTDGGQSWALANAETLNVPQQILFDPSGGGRVVVNDGLLYLSQDSGQSFLPVQGPIAQNNVTRIAFAPNGALFAATNAARVYRATAPFASWVELTRPWSTGNTFPTAFTVDPTDPQVLYIAIQTQGVFRSQDGGVTWTGPLVAGFTGAASTFINQLLVSPANSTHLFAVTGWGVQRSTNRGDTWSLVDGGGAGFLAFDPNDANVILVSRGVGQQSRSVDGGASFSAFGPELRVNGLPEAHYAGSSSRVLFATGRGVGVSVTGGATLEYSATGIGGGFTHRVVKADDGAIFVSQGSRLNDIFLRRDPAVSPNYLPVDGPVGLSAITTHVRQVGALAVAPTNSNILYAVNGGIELVRSSDRGATFSAPHPAFTLAPANDFITDVQIAPDDTDVAYVSRMRTGVWKTVDGGATFVRLANSPDYVGGIAIHPADTSVLYASGGEENASGLYKSTDGGANWTELLAPSDGSNTHYTGFAFHPEQAGTVYALAWGVVQKTVNGGATWQPVAFGTRPGGAPMATALLIDPLHPDTMIALGVSNPLGFLRTVDGGATWAETAFDVPGLDSYLNRGVLVGPGHFVAGTSMTGTVEYTVAPDLQLSLPDIPTLPQGANYQTTLTITNQGTHASTASAVRVSRPAWLTPVVPASCAAEIAGFYCPLGVLRAGQSTTLPLQFAVAAPGAGNQLAVTLETHEPDSSPANNRIDRTVAAAVLHDLDVTVTATPALVELGGTTDLAIQFFNRGPSPAATAQIAVSGLGSFVVESATPTAGACITGATTTCTIGALAANTSVSVAVRLRGNTLGNFDVVTAATAAAVDSDNTDASVTRAIQVRAAAAANPNPGGGGGGRLDWLLLGAVAGMAGWKRKSARG